MHISKLFLAAGAAAVMVCTASSQTTFSKKFYALGEYPEFQVQTDLNGDGIPDFITRNPSQKATELLSTGPGTYATRTISSNEADIPLTAGDFNGDGKNDVFFYDQAGGNKLFSIGYGDGKGGFTSFQQAPNLPGVYTGMQSTIVGQTGDFNGDGKQDIALLYQKNDANGNALSIDVHIYLNNGSGFTDAGIAYNYAMPSGSGGGVVYQTTPEFDLLLGDYDADGHADLAVRYLISPTEGQPSSNLFILYGSGTGKFTPVKVYANRQSYLYFNTADLNDDGASDLASVESDQSIHLFYGHANRTMTETVLPASLNQNTALNFNAPVMADFDGNGLKDIVFTAQDPTSNTESTGVRGLFQTKPGVWVLGPYTKVDDFQGGLGEVPFANLFVGDYNKDRKPDVTAFVTDTAVNHPNTLALLLNAGSRVYGACAAPAFGIHVCSPGASSGSSSVSFNLSATSLYTLRNMQIWVDGVKKSESYHVFATQGYDRVTLSLPAGKHKIGIYAVDMDEATKLHASFTTTVP